MISIIKKTVALLMLTLLLSTTTLSHLVAFASSESQKSIVFMLDSSGSMEENDHNRLAIDSIAQLIYSLPSNYEIGIVSYNTDVSLQTEMTQDRQKLTNQAENVQYNGYTSAGKGLQTTLNLLENTPATDRDIIILSDGEITLESDSKTQAEIELFNNQVKRAEEMGATIHVIGLGEDMVDTSSAIFSGAIQTSGSQHHAPKSVDIQKAIDDILLNQLGVKKSTLGVIESDGTTQNIKVDLPSANMSKVRVLLTSTEPITNLIADFSAENSLQDSGKRYALIELDYPTKEVINITVDSEVGSKIKVELISEYSLATQTEVTYIDTEPENKDAEFYDRTSEITVSFVNDSGKKLFIESYFDGVTIEATIDGEVILLNIENGQVKWSVKVLNDQVINASFDYTNLLANVIGGENTTVSLEKAPIFEKANYLPYILGISILIGTIVIVVFMKKKKKPQIIETPEPSKYYYTGKLNIYITRTKRDLDIPPLTFNLFRLSSGRAISLADILLELSIEEVFEGAEKIFVKPSTNRKIILHNGSDCTVMKSREILMKNKSLEIELDSKVDITFEDETSELMLQYKDA